MKTTKQFMMICCLMVMAAMGYAQQWGIDCDDLGNYSFLWTGIINDQGEAVIVGECGSDNNHFFPMVMRVTEDGEYDYRVFDTIEGNVRPTHIVQLANGTYFASAVVQPDELGVGEDVVFLLLDSDLNILNIKNYEEPEMVLGFSKGGQLMLDDDGTVVFSCGYRYQDTYGQRTKPCFYRFDMNADTLSCRFVTAEQPHPEATMYGYDCYKLLQNPNNDGIVVICAGLNNKNSLLMYDHDFNYEDGFILSPAFRESFVYSYSDHWLSDNRLLLMGDMKPNGEYTKWSIGMAEVGLDGTFDRWDRVYYKQDTAIEASKQCMAYVNDSTIYGGACFYKDLGGECHASACLYDTDMEMLGRKEFVGPEYGDNSACLFVLPMLDGGCLVSISRSYLNNSGYRYGKLIKMSREDFNPIPCSVEEVPQEAVKALAYPNPAKEKVTIDGIEVAEVQVYNALGQLVKTVRNSNEISVENMARGVYLLRISDVNGTTKTKRIMVTK